MSWNATKCAQLLFVLSDDIGDVDNDTQRAMEVGPTLAQRRDCRPDVGPTLDQDVLLSG